MSNRPFRVCYTRHLKSKRVCSTRTRKRVCYGGKCHKRKTGRLCYTRPGSRAKRICFKRLHGLYPH